MMFLLSTLSIIFLATSFSALFGSSNPAGNFESLQKAIILVTLLPVTLIRKKQFRLLLPVVAVLLLFFITIINNGYIDLVSVRRLFGMLIPWVVLLQTWKKSEAKFVLSIIPKLAIVSVVLGLILTAIGFYDFLYYEYTGTIRLRGAISPPHLAFLAYWGVIAAGYQVINNNRKYMIYVYLNILIIALSLSRTASFLILLFYGYLLLFHFRKTLGDNANFFVNQIAFLALLLGFIITIPDLILRSFTGAAWGEILNTSGRLKVWTVFIELGMKKFWLGHGLGFAQQVRDFYMVNNFYVPHNEYINLFYDSGVIGLLIFLTALVIWLFQVLARLQSRVDKRYLTVVFILMLLYALTDNVFNTLQFSLLFTFFAKAVLVFNERSQDILISNKENSKDKIVQSGLVYKL